MNLREFTVNATKNKVTIDMDKVYAVYSVSGNDGPPLIDYGGGEDAYTIVDEPYEEILAAWRGV